jgi:hypothetical protein
MKKESKRKTRSKTLTGYGLLIQTSNQLNSLQLSWESNYNNKPKGKRPNIHEIYSILLIVQKVFPDMSITSNRAEQFNSVHDREVVYRGRRTLEQANNHLKSWILLKYHNKGVQRYFIRQKFFFPMSIVTKASHLLIDGIKLK